MEHWRAVAAEAAEEMREAGAVGVALMGSYARGDAHRLSDVDVVALGGGEPEFRIERGVVLSLSWVQPEDAVRSFGVPNEAVWSVPGWRTAVPLSDPVGRVQELRAAAKAWTWGERLDERAGKWLAKEVVGYCEEVFGLLRSLDTAATYPTAVVRSVFALRCAGMAAVRHGILWESEKHVWELVAARQGPEWRRAQEAAFGLHGERIDVSAKASLVLYRLLVADAWSHLTAGQRDLVQLALDEIRRVEG